MSVSSNSCASSGDAKPSDDARLCPPMLYSGRSREELVGFCERLVADFGGFLGEEAPDIDGAERIIVQGLRPALVTQLFSAAFSLHASSTPATWRHTCLVLDSLFLVSRFARGNPEPVKQLHDHVNCVFNVAKIALDQAMSGGEGASDVFISCIRNLEILHDPKLRWRRWLLMGLGDLDHLFIEFLKRHEGNLKTSRTVGPTIFDGPSQNWPSTPLRLNADILPWALKCLSKSSIIPQLQIHFVHLISSMAVGNMVSPKQVIAPDVILRLSDVVAEGTDSPKNLESALALPFNLRTLAAKALAFMAVKLHNESPEDLDPIRAELVALLHHLVDILPRLPETLQFTALYSVFAILWVRSDRSSLQCSLLNGFESQGDVFNRILSVIEGSSTSDSTPSEDPLRPSRDREPKGKAFNSCLVVLAVKTFTAVFKHSSLTKDAFAQLVTFKRFAQTLQVAVARPSRDIYSSLFFAAFESNTWTKGNSNQSIANPGFVKIILDRVKDAACNTTQEWVCETLTSSIFASTGTKLALVKFGFVSMVIDALNFNISAATSPISPGRAMVMSERTLTHLISLLENLASLSVSSVELKKFFALLRSSVYCGEKDGARIDEESSQASGTETDMGFLFPRLLHSLCVMAKREGQDLAKSFFDLTKDSAGITVPGFSPWPPVEESSNANPKANKSSPSLPPLSSFSFFTWVQLDQSYLAQHSYLHRRQLYAFTTTSGNGFEAFFTPTGVLVVGVTVDDDFFTASVTGTPFTDSYWHSILVSHSVSRRPFTPTTLQVHVDGVLRLSVPLKFPIKQGDGIASCGIGWFGGGRSSRRTSSKNTETQATQSPSAKNRISSTAGSMFSAAVNLSSSAAATVAAATPFVGGGSLRLYSAPSSVTTTSVEMKDQIWGIPISLKGRLGQVCVMSETIQPSQVKPLISFSSPAFESTNVFDSQPGLEILREKRVFHFHPNCCKDNVCHDLAKFVINGRLTGMAQHIQCLKESLVGAGGLNAIFLLVREANVWAARFPSWNRERDNDSLNDSESIKDDDSSSASPSKSLEKLEDIDLSSEKESDSLNASQDWVILPPSSPVRENDNNPVAVALNLLAYLVAGSSDFQRSLVRSNGIAILGALLSKMTPLLVDSSLLAATKSTQELLSPFTLLNSLFLQNVVFEFSIWTKSPNQQIRVQHLQYVATLIKDDPPYFRSKFGIVFFLDVVRRFYGNKGREKPQQVVDDMAESEEESIRVLRNAMFGLIKFQLISSLTSNGTNSAQGAAHSEDLDSILSFVYSTAATGEFELSLCGLNLILSLLDNSKRGSLEIVSKGNRGLSLYKSGTGHPSLSNISSHMQSLASIPTATLTKAISVATGTVKTIATTATGSHSTNPSTSSNSETARRLIHTLFAEPQKADSLFALLSPDFPFDQRTFPRKKPSASDANSSAATAASSSNDVAEIPFVIRAAAMHVIAALLRSSWTPGRRKHRILFRDGVTMATVATQIVPASPSSGRMEDESTTKSNTTGDAIKAASSTSSSLVRLLTSISLDPVVDSHHAVTAFVALLQAVPPEDCLTKALCLRGFLSRLLRNAQEMKALNNEVVGWAGILVNLLVTKRPALRAPKLARAGGEQTEDATISGANEAAATEINSPRERSHSLIDHSALLAFTDNKRFSMVTDLTYATTFALTGFSQVIKDLPHHIYSTASILSGSTEGSDPDIDEPDSEIDLSSDEDDDDETQVFLDAESQSSNRDGAAASRPGSFHAANPPASTDSNSGPPESDDDRRHIAERLEQLSMTTSRKKYEASSSDDEGLPADAEFKELLSLTLFFAMWPDPGAEVPKLSWQVFVALQRLHKRLSKARESIVSVEEQAPALASESAPAWFARRILEIFAEKCLVGIRASSEVGPTSSTVIATAMHVLKLIYHFAQGKIFKSLKEPFSEILLLGVCDLMDEMAVWDDGIPGMEWTELARLGLSLLLTAASSRQLVICSLAAAKLHTLVQVRPLQSKEEICYLMYHINELLFTCSSDHYAFIIPVMKTLLIQGESLLGGFVFQIPNLPSPSQNSMFLEDFQVFSQTDEWKSFMADKVRPKCIAYQAAVMKSGEDKKKAMMEMKQSRLTTALTSDEEFDKVWRDSRIGMYKANKLCRKMHLKQSAQFMELVLKPLSIVVRQDLDKFRRLAVSRKQTLQMDLHRWNAIYRGMIGLRGCWYDGLTPEDLQKWKLAPNENFSRMRTKLVPDLSFDPHTDASNLRDNVGPSESKRIGADIDDEEEEEEEERKDDEKDRQRSSSLLSTSLSMSSLASAAAETPFNFLHQVSQKNLLKKHNDEDRLTEEEWRRIMAAEPAGGNGASSIHESISSSDPTSNSKEARVVMTTDAVRIFMMDSMTGKFTLSSSHVTFSVTATGHLTGLYDFQWSLDQLREVHFRRFNLRRSALEFFLTNQTTYLVNFPSTEVRNEIYSKIVALRPSALISYSARSPADLLKNSGLTQKWVKREICNFEYLIQLNTIAGRSYNDLSQYPVFPWILKNYSATRLELNDPTFYRDLSRPVGAVNPKNRTAIRDKYESFEDPTGSIPKFHYGTHYSNPAGVLHYMIRLEPFTRQHIQLQSGRFDVADRQFHSIASTWESLYETPNDVKELVPEFFYLPEFLENVNSFNLGQLQFSKEAVNHVVLPKWAKNAEDFVHKHRQALESEIVSQNLHEWIDLIFGHKQRGPAAVEALNVFYHCTYEGAIDLDAIKDINERRAVESMINNFGQTPCQLLKEPHPKRLTLEEAAAKAESNDRPLSIFNFLKKLKAFFVEVTVGDPLIFAQVPRSQVDARGFMQAGLPESMITVSKSGFVGVHGWLPYDRAISNYFTFEIDQSLENPRLRRSIRGPRHPDLSSFGQTVVVSHDGKILFTCGHWDNSIRVWNLQRGKTVNHIVKHSDVVTCLALDATGTILMSGSNDSTCMLWTVKLQGGLSIGIQNSVPKHVLTGHDGAVTCVAIVSELDLAASGSVDGTVIVYTVEDGLYMYTIAPPLSTDVAGVSMSVLNMCISEERHIVIYCQEVCSSSVAALRSSAHGSPTKHFLFSYSINRRFSKAEKMSQSVGAMAVTGQHLLVGLTNGTLLIKELHEMRTMTSLSLHGAVASLDLTPARTHVLVGLDDGRLIVVGVDRNFAVKKGLIR